MSGFVFKFEYYTLFIFRKFDRSEYTSVIKIRNDIAYLPNDDEAFSGRYETYYSNGQKKKSVSYKNGRINGLVTYWNKNGQVIVKQSYKDGKPDELFNTWQKNGQKRLEKISQGR